MTETVVRWVMRLLVFLGSLATALFATSSTAESSPVRGEEGISELRSALLDRHSFSRGSFNPDDLELLAGNGEMGGLVRRDGLGLDRIWAADLWENESNRIPLSGLGISWHAVEFNEASLVRYSQTQSLRDGVVRTEVKLRDGRNYETEVLFSAAESRLLLVRVRNTGNGRKLSGHLHLPVGDYVYLTDWPDYQMGLDDRPRYRVRQIEDGSWMGVEDEEHFTPSSWTLRSNLNLAKGSAPGELKLTLAPGEEVVLRFSLVTAWQAETHQEASRQAVLPSTSDANIWRQHWEAWQAQWENTPVLKLPDTRHEELFYRSVFWLYCTAGSERFLPGEAQFGMPAWNMRPFTYGAAGWATLAFMNLGDFDRAKRMLMNHFKPEGLIANAKLYLEPSESLPAAFSFAHEVRTDGTTNGVNDNQRHLNGFALAMYHRYYQLTGDAEFLENYLYPVAAGVAEYWSRLAAWDEQLDGYKFPELRSVSENLVEESVLDVVLAARWSLDIAVHYANLTGRDPDAKERWNEVVRQIHIPQNTRHYLEFLGDTESREFSAYQGVRAPFYLGFPGVEMATTVDSAKAVRTIDHAWNRNARGEGMLGFIAAWYALAALSFGEGDLALEMADRVFDSYEPSQTALSEGPNNTDRFYFLTTTAAYLNFPLHMLNHRSGNDRRVISAVPSTWGDVEFHNVPVGSGEFASGLVREGSIIRWDRSKER